MDRIFYILLWVSFFFCVPMHNTTRLLHSKQFNAIEGFSSLLGLVGLFVTYAQSAQTNSWAYDFGLQSRGIHSRSILLHANRVGCVLIM